MNIFNNVFTVHATIAERKSMVLFMNRETEVCYERISVLLWWEIMVWDDSLRKKCALMGVSIQGVIRMRSTGKIQTKLCH